MSNTFSARIKWHKSHGSFTSHSFHHQAQHHYDDTPPNTAWVYEQNGAVIESTYRRGDDDGERLFRQISARAREIKEEQQDAHKEATGRKCRKDANHFTELLITFGDEVQPREHESLDEAAQRLLDDYCQRWGVKPLVLTRHNDESKDHYQALTTAVPEGQHKAFTKQFGIPQGQELQDMGAEHFTPLCGIERGVRKAEKLKQTREATERRPDESDQQYNRRVYEAANVRHRTVQELHRDREKDTTALETQLGELEVKNSAVKTILDRQEERYTTGLQAINANKADIKSQEALIADQERQKERLATPAEQAEEAAAVAAILDRSVQAFASRVEKEAPYLVAAPGSRSMGEQAKAKVFAKCATEVDPQRPQQVAEDLQEPSAIPSFARLQKAHRAFEAGLAKVAEMAQGLATTFKAGYESKLFKS